MKTNLKKQNMNKIMQKFYQYIINLDQFQNTITYTHTKCLRLW